MHPTVSIRRQGRKWAVEARDLGVKSVYRDFESARKVAEEVAEDGRVSIEHPNARPKRRR